MPQAYKHNDKEVIVHCFVMLIKIGPHFKKKKQVNSGYHKNVFYSSNFINEMK